MSMAEKTEELDRNLYAVIMAGGKGTRFWPVSRESFPKQFLKLVGERTLLQDTIHRLDGEVDPENIIIVTTRGQKDIVEWQVKEVASGVDTIVEPEGKNTAPAIALVAFKLHRRNPDAVMLVMPSDHFIEDAILLRSTLRKAVPFTERGRIITFGIRPTRPETGYGYIKAGEAIEGDMHEVARFVEKPDRETAERYLKEGGYFWNSGMFLFRAGDMVEELRTHMPDLYEAFARAADSLDSPEEEEAVARAYGEVADESIDYGVMEKSTNVAMQVAEFPWSDIGSWSALEEVLERDARGNVRIGNIVDLDCEGSIFFAGDKLVAAIGLRDLVVVDTTDATLIVPKSRVQQVKELVGRLKEEGKEEYLAPSLEERPWGYFSVLEQGEHHKIKHIYLKPGARLSLQMHNHRSEHWIVVAGTAKVQRDEEVFFVHQNESTFIPSTVKHRLENPGIIPLRIVEIQSGEYLGEDDITRFDDIYGRNTR
jgi:mannose-1-phosphate guanylyltransferase/mannose-6-phosphate isomerase